METTVVLNHFPRTIFFPNFFIRVKSTLFLYNVVVAMVTKSNFVLQNLTFLCFDLHSSIINNKHKYQELFFSVLAWKMALPYK